MNSAQLSRIILIYNIHLIAIIDFFKILAFAQTHNYNFIEYSLR